MPIPVKVVKGFVIQSCLNRHCCNANFLPLEGAQGSQGRLSRADTLDNARVYVIGSVFCFFFMLESPWDQLSAMIAQIT